MRHRFMPFDLWEEVVSWENLWRAYRKAAKTKRGRYPAAAFEHQVADRLLLLQQELTTLTYQPGAYTHFYIHDPKKRKISAAPFRDRVVHHALCNVIEPLFEQRFFPHSYANRVGKGTHAAIDRLQCLAGHYGYVLRADIVKHFPSIDHAILLAEIEKAVQDKQVLGLVALILASGAGVLADEYDMVHFPGDDLFAYFRPRGLPIGNLTSQFWSNVYMNPFDWFIARDLGCNAYLRYVDDFALFGHDKQLLYRWKRALIDALGKLRLTIHRDQAQVIPVEHGIPWLGFVVYPKHRKLKARNAVKFTRCLEGRWADYCAGRITFAEFDATVQGWINHVRYGDTWGLRTHILGKGRVFP
jgi:hypothetical protein